MVLARYFNTQQLNQLFLFVCIPIRILLFAWISTHLHLAYVRRWLGVGAFLSILVMYNGTGHVWWSRPFQSFVALLILVSLFIGNHHVIPWLLFVSILGGLIRWGTRHVE